MATEPAGTELDRSRQGDTSRVPGNLLRLVVLRVLLVLAAYVLAVDLGPTLRSWTSIALHVWVVGNLAAALGLVLLRVVAVPASVPRR